MAVADPADQVLPVRDLRVLEPGVDAALAAVIGGDGQLLVALEILKQEVQVPGTHADVRLGDEGRAGRDVLLQSLGDELLGRRHDLHRAAGANP